MPERLKAAALVSGGGTNLEALLRSTECGDVPGVKFALVISSREDAYALKRARDHGVPTVVVDPKRFASDTEFQEAVLFELVNARIDIVCLAGYLRRIGPAILGRFRGRMLNIHPALLPKFGGPGMWGRRVHEAVLASGEVESGCTVHLVDEEYDHGPILAQARVPVLPGDTAETLAARVLEQEHGLYPRVLRQLSERILKGESLP